MKLLITLLIALPLLGGTYTAATCSQSDVSAVINVPTHTAVTGDTVIIPNGSRTWSSELNVPVGITLQGYFTHCTGCAIGSAASGWPDAAYILNATGGGGTSVTCTYSSTSSFFACGVLEYAWSGASITFGTPGVGNDTACTTCAGQALTITGTNVIVQAGIPANNLTAITGSYTSPSPGGIAGTDGAGLAGWINATGTPTTPNWTQDSSGVIAVLGMPFQGH